MSPELAPALRFAETRIADLIQQNEMQVLEFNGYGKNFITSMGFSPDAFVQMAFQAAYYGLYGRVESTYEPAMTKAFLHGRTEAIRTVTEKSVDFVRKFCEDAQPADKVQALREACKNHTAITRECSKGLGQDRHLYALFCVWQRGLGEEATSDGEASSAESEMTISSPTSPTFEYDETSSSISTSSSQSRSTPTEKIPAIFNDAAWGRLNTTILSTSNCGNPALRLFGFGPTSADGFGLGYIIKNDSISVCVSSKHRQTKRFIDTLANYFAEIRQILKQVSRESETALETLRIREVEAQAKLRSGRPLRSVSAMNLRAGESDEESGIAESEDSEYGLGGYGYFDAGKSLGQLLAKGKQDLHEARERHGGNRKRRHSIGRAIRLAEY